MRCLVVGVWLLLNIAFVGLGVLVGYAWFYLSVHTQVGEWFHLRNRRERLWYFLSPFPPRNMLVLTGVSGDTQIWVDVDVHATEGGYMLETPAAIVITPVLKKTYISMLESSIVPGVYSPYALAWRCLSGWMVGFLFSYYSIILATPPELFGLTLEFLIPVILLINYIVFMFGSVFTRLTTRGIETYVLVATALNPPSIHAVPAVGPLGISPVEYAQLTGGNISIKVDKEAVKALEEISSMLGVKEPHAGAELLASAHLLRLYRQKIASLLGRIQPLVEAERILGRAEALRLMIPRTVFLLIAFLIGLALGWALGGGDIVVSTPPAP